MTKPDFKVILAGGEVRNIDGGVTGEATLDFISQFRLDFGILGISGIDHDGSLLDFDYHEVRVKRAIIENSRCVFLGVDHTKFGRNAMLAASASQRCLGAPSTSIEEPKPMRYSLHSGWFHDLICGTWLDEETPDPNAPEPEPEPESKTTWRPPQTSPEVVRYIIQIALACSMCLGVLVKTSAKWFCGLVVVSTFLKFPIQMNFAENKKWPTSPIWRAAD